VPDVLTRGFAVGGTCRRQNAVHRTGQTVAGRQSSPRTHLRLQTRQRH
jgi:hypothetical protein